MKNIEIERKFLIKKEFLPKNLKTYKSVEIEQCFIYLKPVIRIRRMDDKYYLTLKSKPPKDLDNKNDLVRSEYEVEITKKAYKDLSKMCSGRIIKKTRFLIPYKKFTIELDVFKNEYKGLYYAEVEFKNINDAKKFIPPDWFYKDVTGIDKYKNTSLSVCKKPENIVKY